VVRADAFRRQRLQPLGGAQRGAPVAVGVVGAAQVHEELLGGAVLQPLQLLQRQRLLRAELLRREVRAAQEVRVDLERLVEVVGQQGASERGILQLRAPAPLHPQRVQRVRELPGGPLARAAVAEPFQHGRRSLPLFRVGNGARGNDELEGGGADGGKMLRDDG
jgi:hypothetical protein